MKGPSVHLSVCAKEWLLVSELESVRELDGELTASIQQV